MESARLIMLMIYMIKRVSFNNANDSERLRVLRENRFPLKSDDKPSTELLLSHSIASSTERNVPELQPSQPNRLIELQPSPLPSDLRTHTLALSPPPPPNLAPPPPHPHPPTTPPHP